MHFEQKELTNILNAAGADLVGFADLSTLLTGKEKNGVAVALKLPKEIVVSLNHGPNRAYFDTYHSMNARLNKIVSTGAEYINDCGFHAFAQTTKNVSQSETFRTKMPHKTVATRAGLGWIGKSALLITKEYGAALRLSSILTDAPLVTAVPVEESRCKDCLICTSACPAGAISGKEWSVVTDRNDFYNAAQCYKKAREISAAAIGEKITLCGKCIAVCPYTKRYLNGK